MFDDEYLWRADAKLIAPLSITGRLLTARQAEPDDAAFILSLRTDPQKSRYISPTPDDLAKQRDWLSDYADIYLIFEHQGRPVGTARLYDQSGAAHTWGSWILAHDRPSGAAAESALMVYWLSAALRFSCARFTISKPNEQCWGFLETLGAVRVGENADEFHYEQRPKATEEALKRHGLEFSATWADQSRFSIALPSLTQIVPS